MDVILLDLFLEDSSGLESLFRVREAAPDVPVVVLTGHADEDHALKALKNGAQDYLIKNDVHIQVLFRVIRYAIERKQAERERALVEKRLLQSCKLEAVGTLAAGVAHNFNNALTVILGHSKLVLEKASVDADTRRHLESITKAGERAAALTRQLLTFSRKRTAEPTAINLNKVIVDMQVLLESTLDAEIQLELNLAPDLDAIKAEPGQIGQVLMNLLMNARSAMSNGGKLSLQTANRAGKVLLKITDTGCGMPPETCARIFEPFFTTRSLAEASGLGLSTVYGIVEQYGGSIEVASKPGEGTEFLIAFPAVSGFGADGANRPATILVVQNRQSGHTLSFRALDGIQQYLILKAGDWREALEVADCHKGTIDLLVADIVMPAMVRPHFLRLLAGERPGMKFIYISSEFARTFEKTGDLPPGTYLDQTLTRETLLRSVRDALSGPSAAKRNAFMLEPAGGR
jgi:signal transduction histidine kinase